jgi:hypothetical protein
MVRRLESWLCVLVAALLAAPAFCQFPTLPLSELCDEVVTTAYPRWASARPRQTLPRVEVRVCRVDERGWGFLQIAAFEEHASQPSLLVDTLRTTIVKMAMAGDVFVLETAGASSNVVQVIVYEKGVPRLVLHDAIKAYAHIDMSWKKVVVGLPQQDGSEIVHEFPTGMY